MKKILTLLIIVLVLGSTLAITETNTEFTWGRTLEVGEGKSYLTIQEAVDDAKWGDTILVYPGFYEESVLVTTDNLKIIAQDEGVEVYSPIRGTAPIRVYANHVTVRGFSQLTGIKDCVPGLYFEGSYNIFVDNVIDPGSCPG